MDAEHRQQKISFWHSMKTQFIAVVLLVAAVIVTLYTVMIMPGVKSNIRSIYSNYLLDLSISYGKEMDNALAVNPDLLANTDEVQKTLQEVNIEGAKTAYAYLVDFNGTMLYHPSAEKIGQPVENEAVKKMLKENTKRHDSKAGKGFAVVAAQIQKLAEQSNESAKRIDEIIHELLKDSENAVHTMEEVKEIMHEQNEKVQKTSEAFAKMQEGVGVSIRGMSVIDEQTKKIKKIAKCLMAV